MGYEKYIYDKNDIPIQNAQQRKGILYCSKSIVFFELF